MNHGESILIGILFFWAGFVSAISFMEAWIKFRAKGVTLPVGLRIGKKVFGAMNRLEWVFLLLYLVLFIYLYKISFGIITILSVVVLVILALQTAYLLPKLDKRADLLIEGKSIGKSLLHVYYVVFELIKVWILILLGFLHLCQMQNMLVNL